MSVTAIQEPHILNLSLAQQVFSVTLCFLCDPVKRRNRYTCIVDKPMGRQKMLATGISRA